MSAKTIDSQDVTVYEKSETIEEWAQTFYHPLAVAHYDRAVAGMIKAMGVQPGQTVLDAGCGTGVHSIRAARLGCVMRSIDISEAMLNTARKNAEQAKLETMPTFQQEDLTELSLEDNSVDHAFSWGVMVHIRKIEKALAELVRVVKPGGSIALQITNTSAIDHKIEDTARKLLRGKKPLNVTKHPLGDGYAWEWNGSEIFTWRNNAKAIAKHLADEHGATLTTRRISEMTELQQRFPGFMAAPIHVVNALAWKLGMPAAVGVTQLLVFKTKAD
ncbi:MAG: class I SAM-dependent methyltransferase [Phycisphaeraceae bacterium]